MIKLLTLAIAMILTLASPFLGAMDIDLSKIWLSDALEHRIFFELRLPRLMLAFFSGVILALSGWLFQTLFRNALMTPFTLGVSGGAVLGTGIAVVLGLNSVIIGVSLTASMVRIENIPPMLNTTYRAMSGAMCFDNRSPNTAQTPIRTKRKS